MKTWHIQTWGAGTPHYLVSAETKEEAWDMVEEEWRKKYKTKVGYQDLGVRGEGWQTEVFLEEIVGLTTQTSLIVDLNES